MSTHCLEGLKLARIRSSIPVEKIAESIGVSVTTYYRYEAGSRRIYFDKACRLADLMGVSLDDLRRPPSSDTVVAAQELAGWVAD